MTYLTTLITHKQFFMIVITFLFACSAIRNAWGQDWNLSLYGVGAVIINLAVIMKG